MLSCENHAADDAAAWGCCDCDDSCGGLFLNLCINKSILHNGTTSTENIEINEKFGAGKFELKLTGHGVVVVTVLMKR